MFKLWKKVTSFCGNILPRNVTHMYDKKAMLKCKVCFHCHSTSFCMLFLFRVWGVIPQLKHIPGVKVSDQMQHVKSLTQAFEGLVISQCSAFRSEVSSYNYRDGSGGWHPPHLPHMPPFPHLQVPVNPQLRWHPHHFAFGHPAHPQPPKPNPPIPAEAKATPVFLLPSSSSSSTSTTGCFAVLELFHKANFIGHI